MSPCLPLLIPGVNEDMLFCTEELLPPLFPSRLLGRTTCLSSHSPCCIVAVFLHITCKRSRRGGKSKSSTSSWKLLRRFFSCKRIGCSASICRIRGGGPSVISPETTVCSSASSRSLRSPSKCVNGAAASASFSSSSHSSHSSASITTSSSSASSLGGSFRGGGHLRKLSGCYECNVMLDPVNGPCKVSSMRAATVCPCPECGEVFLRPESLESHQAVRHAVSEMGPEDSSRNIIEIIFQSSWLKNQSPFCRIERILKVHNPQKSIARFEEYRDSVKMKAARLGKKHPRCIADGNELLRFHAATFACALGLGGSTSLCQGGRQCGACSVIRDGFRLDECGRIRTMASSGRAHDTSRGSPEDAERRAMLVCRVIAGRVKRSQDVVNAAAVDDEFDSVTGLGGGHSSVDELFVFSPKAILPCFIVIYRSF